MGIRHQGGASKNKFFRKMTQTICLSMIVKNEATVIRRCLDSVKKFITHWVIVDTGSTDGTQDIIRDYMAEIPGKLYEREWKDFAHNRSEALNLSRNMSDYSLIIDADDALVCPEGFVMPKLAHGAYTMNILDDPLIYPRIQLVRNNLHWRYRGVLHEFVACDQEHTIGSLSLGMRRNHDGARRKDPTVFLRDVEIFEKALASNKEPDLKARYTFYLAQSYRDAKKLEKSLENYLKRAKMGEWVEEVYVSYLYAGKLMEELKYEDAAIINAYSAAIYALPSRAEASQALSKFYRVRQLYEQGYQAALTALGKPMPMGGVFAESWVYSFGLLDELAVCAYWTERYEQSIDACLKILETGLMPKSELPRVVNNVRYAMQKLLQKEQKTEKSNG
jgi:glycosyltransferase involved in cell wall biosynthesis